MMFFKGLKQNLNDSFGPGFEFRLLFCHSFKKYLMKNQMTTA